MSAWKKFASRAGRAAAVAAVTVGMSVGLAAAPASAAPAQSGANLTITYAGSGYYKVTVKGVFAMSAYDAHGYMNNLSTGTRAAQGMGPGGIYYHVTGDDPGSYDSDVWMTGFYAGPQNDVGGYLFADSRGINFHRSFLVPASRLNEDNGYWDKTDEIYADATFIDGDNGSRVAYSNVVTNLF